MHHGFGHCGGFQGFNNGVEGAEARGVVAGSCFGGSAVGIGREEIGCGGVGRWGGVMKTVGG